MYFEKHKIVYDKNKNPILYFSDIKRFHQIGYDHYSKKETLEYQIEVCLQKLVNNPNIKVKIVEPLVADDDISFDIYFDNLVLMKHCTNYISIESIQETISLVKKFNVSSAKVDTHGSTCELTLLANGYTFKLDNYCDNESRNIPLITENTIYEMSMKIARTFRKEGKLNEEKAYV